MLTSPSRPVRVSRASVRRVPSTKATRRGRSALVGQCATNAPPSSTSSHSTAWVVHGWIRRHHRRRPAAAVHGWIRRHHRRHPSRIAESQPRRAFETGRSASGSPGTRVSGCRVDAAGDAPPKAPPAVREFTRARTSAQGAPATTTGTKVATGGGRRAAQPCRAQSQPERPGSRRRGPRVPRLPFPTGHG